MTQTSTDIIADSLNPDGDRLAAARHRLARLRADAADVSRRLLETSDTVSVVAREYGVGRSAVSRAARGLATADELEAARGRKIAARKRGVRPAGTGHNTAPLGTVVFRRPPTGPYALVKVAMGGPEAGRWRPLAVVVWERHHGRVPRGWAVVHRTPDQLDDRVENLEAIPPGERIRRAMASPDRQRLRAEALRRFALGRTARLRSRGLTVRHRCRCDACEHERPGRARPDEVRCPKCGSDRFRARQVIEPVRAASVRQDDPPPPPAATPAGPADPRVVEHLTLARGVAARMHRRMPRHVDLGDVESAAVDGLFAACRTYDPAAGASFRTHATRRVRGAVLDWQRGHGWAKRGDRERAGTDGERRILAATDVDAPVSPLAIASAVDAGCPVETDELWRRVLRSVPARSGRLLALMYRNGLGQREAGDRIGVSESRASQLHADAIGRLRKRWTADQLAEAMGLGSGRTTGSGVAA